jgi:hypothetical protein
MTPPTADAARTPVPHRGLSTLLSLVPSALALVATALLVLSWRDDLPDPVAVHFGPDGADGYGSLGSTLAVLGAVFGALAVGGWLLAVLRGRNATARRLGVGLGTGLSVFGSVLVGGSLALQRGLADAAATPDIDPVVLLAIGAGLLTGGLCAWAVPGDPPAPATDPVPLTGPHVPLGAHERATWTGRVRSPAAIGIGGTMAVGVGVLVVVLRMPALLVLVLAMAALVLTSAVVVVTVDARGLLARSSVGWPRFRVPLDEITGVEVVQVRPLRQHGGWGFRITLDGQVGYVVRTGEAIEVTRTNGRTFVVTVDDAATGAALLTTLTERSRAGSPR